MERHGLARLARPPVRGRRPALEERLDVQAVIFDYGCVLCLDQPAEDRARIEALAAVDPARFWAAYWEGRPDYDRGEITAHEFWAWVAGQTGATWGEGERETLIREDVASWIHMDWRMVAWLEALADAGIPVGLLSNAPVEVRDAVLGQAWARRLAHATFSCDVGSLKPEPEIYRHCLEGLGVAPADALFIDDRAVNVEGAERVGLRAVRFVGPGDLASDLAGIDGLPRLAT
jgi:putative hydrolase of the HAD superfamily